MRKYVIEREIPAIGAAEPEELAAVARRSNEIAEAFRPDVQWVHSYVAANKTYCVYLAKDEETLRAYVAETGFPADRISEISKMIDPTTAA